MLEKLIGGLIDKEGAIKNTIQDAMTVVANELKCSHKDFFLMIRPTDEEFNHRYYICKYDDAGNPQKVREITLKEILSASDKE